MVIERTVIRYIPVEAYKGGAIGVARYPMPVTPKHTAVYPDVVDPSVIAFIAETAGYYSQIRTYSSSAAPSEYAFVPLASDGMTLAPLTPTDTSVVLCFGDDDAFNQRAFYTGGVVEVGAYVGGQYFVLGSNDLCFGRDEFSCMYDWVFGRALPINLDWSDLPGAPAFWTSMRGAYEV